MVQVDLNSDESLEKAVATLQSKHGRIDSLINNGGGSFDSEARTGHMTLRESWNATWDTNVSGTNVLTTLATPLLMQSSDARILFVTSGTSTLTETESTATPVLQRLNSSPPAGWPKDVMGLGFQSYRASKTGLNMLMREWHRMLRNDGIKVWAISPGFLATNLGGAGAEKLKQVSFDPYVLHTQN